MLRAKRRICGARRDSGLPRSCGFGAFFDLNQCVQERKAHIGIVLGESAAMNLGHASNHLLAALPVDVKERLAPHLEFVALPHGEILLVGDSEHYIHFPADAIIGVLQVLANGKADGVFLVGNEGMVGVSYCLGAESSPNRAIVLKPGWAYRIPASGILDEFRHDSSLLKLILRYTQTRIAQAAATLACNRYHSIRQQLSRFLLMYMDRLHGNRLPTTQEVIARWLGVRRESVAEAANKLRELGIIDYQRGYITVLDKPRLEALTCECYGLVEQETHRVLAWERQYAVRTARRRATGQTYPGACSTPNYSIPSSATISVTVSP